MSLLHSVLLRIRPAWLADRLKRLARVERREIETPHGQFWVDPASQFGRQLELSRDYEPDVRNLVEAHLPAGGTFVDIGANEGFFSVVAARRVGASGRVVAVEPQSRLQTVLETNFRLNGCSSVELHPLAVTGEVGPLALSLSPTVNSGASSTLRGSRASGAVETVNSVTLQGFWDESKLENCDVLKIDIEGAEYAAVMGSKDLFRSGLIRALALELHPKILEANGLSTSRLMDFLSECGYDLMPHPVVTFWRHRG